MDDFIQLLCMFAMVGGFLGLMFLLWRVAQMDARDYRQRRRYQDDEDDAFWDDVMYLDMLDDEDGR